MTLLIEPDLKFIRQMSRESGMKLKRCFQCATCSVVCNLSPDDDPYPRRQIMTAAWGLKAKLLGDLNLWLCHNCGDCSTQCPRDAGPAEVLAAARAEAISFYARPQWLARFVSLPQNLPAVILAPALIFLTVGWLTGWLDFTPAGDDIVSWHFFSQKLVDIVFLPLALFVMVSFGLSLKSFWGNLTFQCQSSGRLSTSPLEPVLFLKALGRAVLKTLRHEQFDRCTLNKPRATAHLMVSWGFAGLLVTTGFVVLLYFLNIYGPFSQLGPLKWLANVSGIVLMVGIILMLIQRRRQAQSRYFDWYQLGLILALGVTGFGAEMARLYGSAVMSYTAYFLHLTAVFNLFLCLPYTKLAHMVYRTTAMAIAEYIACETD